MLPGAAVRDFGDHATDGTSQGFQGATDAFVCAYQPAPDAAPSSEPGSF
jgi:hypothetical protein